MPARKKILVLIEWFAPGYKAGGPIQSCINLCIALRDNHDIYVFTTDTDHGEITPYPGVNVNGWFSDERYGVQVYYARKKTLGMKQVLEAVRSVKADFIYLNLLFSPYFVLFPLWLKFTGRIKEQVILCPRGTLYDSAVSLKWFKKKPLLQLMKWMGISHRITFHATNKREENAITRFFPASKIIIADNLPDLMQPGFISCPKNPGYLKCIFIARIVPIKNLLYLLKLLRSVEHSVALTIVGPVEHESYWGDCKKAITELAKRIEIKYEGPVQKDKLAALLQQHHLFILPTTGENFGHAIFEALLSGRPVLMIKPWLDIQEKGAGWAFFKVPGNLLV
ncbi:MAG: glycosyltransferase [Ferruginibacter sp.]